jgi:hypothetical protein
MTRIAQLGRRLVPLLATVALALSAAFPCPADEPTDPSGVWTSQIGELSLLLGSDTLAFSYSAVFGPAAHICDGAGLAHRVAEGRWELVDGDSTIALAAAADGVRLEVTAGVAQFCGAGWGGDRLPLASRRSPLTCTVTAERASFFTVTGSNPEVRKAYVVRGDRVETVPVQNLEAQGFLLARYLGSKSTTLGLLRKADLACPTPEP